MYGDVGAVPESIASTEPPLGMPNDPSVAVSLLSGASLHERARSDADTPRLAAASSLSSPTFMLLSAATVIVGPYVDTRSVGTFTTTWSIMLAADERLSTTVEPDDMPAASNACEPTARSEPPNARPIDAAPTPVTLSMKPVSWSIVVDLDAGSVNVGP